MIQLDDTEAQADSRSPSCLPDAGLVQYTRQGDNYDACSHLSAQTRFWTQQRLLMIWRAIYARM